MKKAIKYFPNESLDHLKENQVSPIIHEKINDTKDNQRTCPSCGLLSIYGMPGGRDATCKNCGYKDPCCYD